MPTAPADVESVRRKYGLPPRYFVHVGGYDPWKNVPGLVRAFALARQSGLEYALVVVGSGGDRRDAIATADSLGLRQGIDIVFVDRVGPELPAFYAGAVAFIALSYGPEYDKRPLMTGKRRLESVCLAVSFD